MEKRIASENDLKILEDINRFNLEENIKRSSAQAQQRMRLPSGRRRIQSEQDIVTPLDVRTSHKDLRKTMQTIQDFIKEKFPYERDQNLTPAQHKEVEKQHNANLCYALHYCVSLIAKLIGPEAATIQFRADKLLSEFNISIYDLLSATLLFVGTDNPPLLDLTEAQRQRRKENLAEAVACWAAADKQIRQQLIQAEACILMGSLEEQEDALEFVDLRISQLGAAVMVSSDVKLQETLEMWTDMRKDVINVRIRGLIKEAGERRDTARQGSSSGVGNLKFILKILKLNSRSVIRSRVVKVNNKYLPFY